ncbi:MAG: hypothetical protein HYX68_25660 [Planctomycetes bacterium]|nr:hypothetical protein [Planctomycetota bacterium]
MRRPRTKLQVTTFPFLAVLLCAMGSLLLLLFIMDRRAKIAAQNKVNESLAKRQERTKAEEDARQAAWEKAKAALHQTLLEQQQELLSASKKTGNQLDDVAKSLDLVQARHLDVQGKLKDEKNKIANLHLQILSQQDQVQQSANKETASRAELLAAARELAELEAAFRQLKALRQRDKQTYSLVPYRGKLGDTRAPIYVECGRDGILFHPEKKLLETFRLTSAAIREEIERHHGPIATDPKPEAKRKDVNWPYVLFLIRPSGIDAYYKARALLKGHRLDFGYELVDEDWALDFSDSGKTKQAASSRPGPASPSGVTLEFPALPRPGGEGGPFKNGGGLGKGPFTSPALTPGGQNGKGLAMQPLAPSSGGMVGQNAGSGNFRITPPSLEPPLPRTGTVPPGPNQGPSFAPIAKTGPPVAIASSGQNAPPALNPALMPRINSLGVKPGANQQEGGPKANPDARPGGSQQTNDAKPDPNGQAPTPGSQGEPGSPSRSGFGPKRKPAPPSRAIGNRDFVITIECDSDAVLVTPGSLIFRWSTSDVRMVDRALVQSVGSLIARRQKSVRPGDPPYRPVIRFLVSREGLRTYYHVYPLLESLRVPMTRENIEE